MPFPEPEATGLAHTELVLEMLKVGTRERVSAFVAESLRLDVVTDAITRDLVYGLSAYVLADQLGPEQVTGRASVSFPHPVNWREHWKREHATIWYGRLILRFWPAKPYEVTFKSATCTHDIRRYRTFPKASIRYPDRLGAPVHMLIPSAVEWSPFTDYRPTTPDKLDRPPA